jgi:competence protein ComEC
MALAWAAIAWSLGLSVSPLLDIPFPVWLMQSAAAAACAVVFRSRHRYRGLFLLVAVVYLGAARVEASRGATSSELASFNDTPALLRIQGVVVEPPAVSGRTTRAHLSAESMSRVGSSAWRDMSGEVQIETGEIAPLSYGDRILATGWLSTPANTPDFPEYDILARQGIFSLMRAVQVDRLAEEQADPLMGTLYRIRERALAVFADTLPLEEASLVGGVVLGADESMPLRLKQIFSSTGTTHILAVSGFNVALVAGAVTAAFGRWLGARRGALASSAAIAVYTLLVGSEPSAVRAAVMAGLTLLARRLGRRGDAAASLGATAIVMTAVEPSLLSDIGFQLSFAATIGLVFVADPLEVLVLNAMGLAGAPKPTRPAAALLREIVLLTAAAQLVTMPLLAHHFGRIPLTALPANFLILPVQPALMTLGGVSALAGMIWLPAGQLFAWMAWPFAAFTLRVVELAARLPAASIPVEGFSVVGVAAAYLLVFAFLVLLKQRGPKPPFLPEVSPWAVVAALAVLSAGIWRLTLDAPDGRLHATLFPSGDVLVGSPSGRFVLVRPPTLGLLPAADLGQRIPLIGGGLDWIVLPTSQAVEGLAASRPSTRLQPMGLLLAGPPPPAGSWPEWHGLPEVMTLNTGVRMNLGGEAFLDAVSVSGEGGAFLVSLGQARILVLEGMPLEAVPPAASTGVQAILTDTPERLGADRPATVWLVAASGNSLGEGTAAGAALLTTARSGWITVHTDGVQLWVETQRED